LLEKCNNLLDGGEGDSAVDSKALNDRIICLVSKSRFEVDHLGGLCGVPVRVDCKFSLNLAEEDKKGFRVAVESVRVWVFRGESRSGRVIVLDNLPGLLLLKGKPSELSV
jgi:hypothetical protein